MIDFYSMIKNEDFEDVILFLVIYREKGISYPSMDNILNVYKASERYESYNIKLIHETKRLEKEGKIFSSTINGHGFIKGPNWREPEFVTLKKYGIK